MRIFRDQIYPVGTSPLGGDYERFNIENAGYSGDLWRTVSERRVTGESVSEEYAMDVMYYLDRKEYEKEYRF